MPVRRLVEVVRPGGEVRRVLRRRAELERGVGAVDLLAGDRVAAGERLLGGGGEARVGQVERRGDLHALALVGPRLAAVERQLLGDVAERGRAAVLQAAVDLALDRVDHGEGERLAVRVDGHGDARLAGELAADRGVDQRPDHEVAGQLARVADLVVDGGLALLGPARVVRRADRLLALEADRARRHGVGHARVVLVVAVVARLRRLAVRALDRRRAAHVERHVAVDGDRLDGREVDLRLVAEEPAGEAQHADGVRGRGLLELAEELVDLVLASGAVGDRDVAARAAARRRRRCPWPSGPP